MKKIVVMNVCAKHPPFDGRVYDKISKTLVKCGYEVHNSSPNIDSMITDDGIYLHGFKQEAGMVQRVKSLFRLKKIIQEVKPDHMTCHEPDALFVAYRYYVHEKRKRRLKLYFDCHEAYEYWFDKATRIKCINHLLCKTMMSVIYYIVKRIDGVTSVNNTMTERFRKINPNSFFLPSVLKTTSEVNYVSNESSGLVFMGSFGMSKQREMFVGAAKILKEKNIFVPIAIIGGSRPGDIGEGSFEEMVVKENVQEYFNYRGWLDREQAFEELKKNGVGIMRFDSYTMPGNYAMPNKLFEYMSLGLALLGCNLNLEIKSIIEKNKCGILIDNETAEDLAEAIIYIYTHPQEIEEMKYNAYMASATEYNWGNYEKLLKHIVED